MLFTSASWRTGIIFYFYLFFFPVAPTQEAAVDDLAGFQLSDAEGMPSGFFFHVFFCVTTIFAPRQRGAHARAQKHLTIRILFIFSNLFSQYIPTTCS